MLEQGEAEVLVVTRRGACLTGRYFTVWTAYLTIKLACVFPGLFHRSW